MTGTRWNLEIEGSKITLPLNKLSVSGDINRDLNTGDITLGLIDGTVVQSTDGNVYIALINRSPDESQRIKITLPEGYIHDKIWKLESDNINNTNTLDNPLISPQITELKKRNATLSLTLSPCGFNLIRCVKP
jgi:alpha-N-arabinofuranosidase